MSVPRTQQSRQATGQIHGALMARSHRRNLIASMPTWVYHAFCQHGSLLYVGVAFDLQRRLKQHRLYKAWWPEVDWIIADLFDNRAEALAQESRVIWHHHPEYNLIGRNPEGCECDAPPVQPGATRMLDRNGRFL